MERLLISAAAVLLSPFERRDGSFASLTLIAE